MIFSRKPKVIEMHPHEVMRKYKNGDETSWADEFINLLENHGCALADLMESVGYRGFENPIVLGNDGRIWDGHHRLLVACLLDKNLPTIAARA